ncbi:MAG TPA: D-alanyl-D-alanine carboxypeptidase/D-alanyl-D-alanine-endopeptidase [Acidisarcina sp.]|nr:D-alanyl-D-alanine carboxypeptidase/D-alanyl-D-alanine-endopeptidase [Acidisarcina sp.]
MRRFEIFTSLLLCALAAGAGWCEQAAPPSQPAPRSSVPGPGSLASEIQSLVGDVAVSRSQWGISVIALDGQPLYALNDAQYFTPASNAKLFTTAAAFALLGPNFVSRTYVVREGAIDASGTLQGGLRLAGTGDPSLSHRSYPYQKEANGHVAPVIPLATAALDDLAEQVARRGIRRVNGPITGDESFFLSERYGTGWGWDDLQWEYGAAVSALTLDENVSDLELQPGTHAGDAIHASWRDGFPYYVAEWQPAGTTSAAGTDRELGVARDAGSMRVRLFGSVPAEARPIHLELAVEQPAEYAANAFRAALNERGVSASGAALAKYNPPSSTVLFEDEVRKPLVLQPLMVQTIGTQTMGAGTTSLPFPLQAGEEIVAVHTSPPLSEEATVINKVSQNLHAELLLRQLGRSQTGEGSFVEGARVVRQFLLNAGIDGDDFFFYDGSGISPQDVVTPRATTALLGYAARQPWGAAYRATLPVAGVDGTLAGRFTQSPVKGRLEAKTGTLGGVHALSGYLTAASGRTVILAIFCNHRRPGNDAERRTVDRIVEAIAAAY